MRKLHIYLIGLAFSFGMYSCQDVNDEFENLDELSTPANDGQYAYTLTSDDYSTIADLALEADENDTVNAAFIESNNYFTDEITSEEYVPYALSDVYSALGEGESVEVTSNYYIDYPEYLTDLANSNEYSLSDADYASVGDDQGTYLCFIGTDKPESYIPEFLSSAEEGDIRLVLYQYADEIVDPSVKVQMGDYYTYESSEWTKTEDVLYLSSEDYDAMGAPGSYDNFSSSDSPDDYLPTYLENIYPYAQSGDIVAVAYNYNSSGSTLVAVEEYQYTTEWAAYNPVTEITEQFKHNGSAWVFDPSLSLLKLLYGN